MHPIGPDPDHTDERTWIADEVIDAELFLTRLVVAVLQRDPPLGAGRIVVSVQNGVVILDGEVHEEATRDEVLRRTREIPGLFDLCCALRVGPR